MVHVYCLCTNGSVTNVNVATQRGTDLLSVVGKLYGGVLIKRVGAGAECAIGEDKCGFRQSRGCMDQVFDR